MQKLWNPDIRDAPKINILHQNETNTNSLCYNSSVSISFWVIQYTKKYILRHILKQIKKEGNKFLKDQTPW